MSELLKAETESILQKPISERRKRAFFESFVADRRTTATTEMLFERVSALRLQSVRPQPEEVEWTGFDVIVFKGPFVELANWAPPSSWEFAVAMERHLLERLEQALRDATEGRLEAPVKRDAASILRTFDVMASRLQLQGYVPTVFILAGPLGTQLAVDLQQASRGLSDAQSIPGIHTDFRIMGAYRGVPILDIPESPSPAVYVVDLARFATLTRYGEEPEFAVEEIQADRARYLLAQNPRLISKPPPGLGMEEERVRQLQLRVHLRLWETYELNLADRDAVVGCPLVGPVID